MEEAEDEVTEFVKKSCLVAGLPFWNNYKNLKKWTRIAWFSYILLHWIILILLTTSMITRFYFDYNNMNVVTSCTVASFYALQFSFKMTFLLKKQKEFTEVFEGMAQVSFDLKSYDEYEKIKRSYFYPLRKIGKIKIKIEAGVVTLYLIISIIERLISEKPLLETPIPLSAPVEVDENPGFSVACLFIILGFSLAVIKTSVIDILVLIFFVLSLSQLRYLRIALKNAFVEAKSPEKKENEGHLDKKVIKEEMLLLWVKRHQKVLRNLHLFKPLCSFYLVFNYGSVLLFLFIVGLSVTMEEVEWDAVKRFVAVSVAVSHLLQLYLLAFIADLLKESETTVADEGVNGNILFSSKTSRSCFLFALTRSKKPIAYTSAGVSPLNCENLGNLLKLTTTYFLTVFQFRRHADSFEKSVRE